MRPQLRPVMPTAAPPAEGRRERPARARAIWIAVGRAILTDRLTHFVVLGAVIFAIAPRPESVRDIAIENATLKAFEQAQAERQGAPRLSPEQLDAVRARAIEDEILYREARRLGLDTDDG